ncbi:MAG: GspE/PulE family protein [Bacillota bacterium]|nr:GspE/PulE family protein [Bacillota bacterium]
MKRFSRRRLEAVLLERGLVDRVTLEKIVAWQKNNGQRTARLLVEKGLLSEEEILVLMEEELNIPRVDFDAFSIDQSITGMIPAEMAKRHLVMPVEHKGETLLLAMVDPFDLSAIDDISMITGLKIQPAAARESVIRHMIAQFYGLPGSSSAREGKEEAVREPESSGYSQNEGEEEAPVVRMVNTLIERAVEEGASDIHLEPDGGKLRLRLRLDGVLHDLTPPPLQLGTKIISRVKIMANLDIAEKRLPQDGHIQWRGRKRGINMRVSTLPTVSGEKIVIRLLERDKIILPLGNLGFTSDHYSALQSLLLNRHGLILVTGPTGCGKTTTLYSALHYLNRPEVNIITVEDPVEYRLQGINQVQVNRRINRTFANALRSILRQDPNIIMVGEIRDLETARMTTQAALTGHLVLSTLHTNHAAGAVTRLIDMGLEEYMITASLLGVIAQRLVRKVCPHCREEYTPHEDEKRFFRHFFGEEAPPLLVRGRGCRYCNRTGYRGRTSIQEILVLNRDLRQLILDGATAEILRQKAVTGGMRSLVMDGRRAIKEGITTADEIVRATFSSIFETGGRTLDETVAYLSRKKTGVAEQ